MKYKPYKLVRTCDSCPSQWEGKTMDGKFIYIRYRQGELYLGVDSNELNAISKNLPKELAFTCSIDVKSNPYAGSLTNDEMKERLKEFIDFEDCGGICHLDDDSGIYYVFREYKGKEQTLLQLESLSPLKVGDKLPEGSKPDLMISRDRQLIDDYERVTGPFFKIEEVVKYLNELGKENEPPISPEDSFKEDLYLGDTRSSYRKV